MSRSTSIMSYLEKNKGFHAEWRIENFSLFNFAGRKPLRSPVFKTNNSGVIIWWRLLVYYSDVKVEFDLIIFEGFMVQRVELFLLSNGTEVRLPLSSKDSVKKVFSFSIGTNEIFSCNVNSFLPQDTLTVCLRIFPLTIIPQPFLFRTVLKTINFRWLIEDFNFYNAIHRSVYQQDSLQLMTLLYPDNKKGTHSLRVETQPGMEGFPCLVNCVLSIQAGRGHCLSTDSISPTTGWLFFLNLENNISDFTFELKCLVAIYMEYQPQSTKLSTSISEASIIADDSMTSRTLKEDLLLLYNEGIDSNATLKTEDKSFPVHKSILSARSKVFRAMFENDSTSEGISGIVDIKDIDSKTLERMLVFVYGDTLEDIQWEDALALYYAADKYAIHSLKLICANLLKAGLTVSNVCQLLVLADNHSDEQLVRVVVEFIRNHDEVISLAEWMELEDSCPKLTTKIMRELYLMQRGAKPIKIIA